MGKYCRSSRFAFSLVPLLKADPDLPDVRSLLGSVRGCGQTTNMSRYGNYASHALYVFDRQKVFFGSMNLISVRTDQY
jgi:cardiolipin synthase C